MSKLQHRFVLILLLLITISACSPGPREYGTLTGQVTIGPLTPAVQVGQKVPTPAPEVYAAREIVVYKKNGMTEFTHLEIGPTGWYQGKLPAGVYVIDINHLGIDRAKGLPHEVVITAGAVTRVDIDIDTGIR